MTQDSNGRLKQFFPSGRRGMSHDLTLENRVLYFV